MEEETLVGQNSCLACKDWFRITTEPFYCSEMKLNICKINKKSPFLILLLLDKDDPMALLQFNIIYVAYISKSKHVQIAIVLMNE